MVPQSKPVSYEDINSSFTASYNDLPVVKGNGVPDDSTEQACVPSRAVAAKQAHAKLRFDTTLCKVNIAILALKAELKVNLESKVSIN